MAENRNATDLELGKVSLSYYVQDQVLTKYVKAAHTSENPISPPPPTYHETTNSNVDTYYSKDDVVFGRLNHIPDPTPKQLSYYPDRIDHAQQARKCIRVVAVLAVFIIFGGCDWGCSRCFE
jgi:hypothetical protein